VNGVHLRIDTQVVSEDTRELLLFGQKTVHAFDPDRLSFRKLASYDM